MNSAKTSLSLITASAFAGALTLSALANSSPMPGDTATIGDGAKGGLGCPATLDKLGDMLKAMSVNDSDGFAESMQGGSTLRPRVKVLVLDSSSAHGLDLKLRLLSGPDAHKVCYMDARIPGLFR